VTSARLLAAWALALALLAVPFACPRASAPVRPTSLFLRLFGPIASAAASVQWVRVQSAIDAGRPDLALARAETALALDPGSTEGWVYLSRHLAFDRASLERESDPERRARWIRAALSLVERGEALAREPAELAVWRGLILVKVASLDPGLPWDGGVAGMWRDAAAAFERAAELSHPEGLALAEAARREATRERP